MVIRGSLEGEPLGVAVDAVERALRSLPANLQEEALRRACGEGTSFYGAGVPESSVAGERAFRGAAPGERAPGAALEGPRVTLGEVAR